MASKNSRALWTAKLTGAPMPSKQALPTPQKSTFTGLVLGIDPSLRGTGLAVLSFKPKQKAQLLYSKTLSLAAKYSQYECLGAISNQVSEILREHKIIHVACEQTVFVQNNKVAHILGAAKGAALGIVAASQIPIAEYAPLRIKQAVVGYGRASKRQVASMVSQLVTPSVKLPSDEADAAAAALCHAMTWSPEHKATDNIDLSII